MTQHCRHLDKIFYKSDMQENLDQVSNWCDNNHIIMVISLIKTKSVTIATRQKHQLLPLLLSLILCETKIDEVSEHHLLGITIDNKLQNSFETSLPSV